MPAGRPVKYHEGINKKAIEYLDNCIDQKKDGKLKVDLPSVTGLAQYLDVPRRTLYDWIDNYEELSHTVDKIKAEQKKRLVNSGLSGEYKQRMAMFLLSASHGMSEKKQVDVTSQGKQIGAVPEPEDKEAIEKFHQQLIENRKKRALEQAVIDGELVE